MKPKFQRQHQRERRCLGFVHSSQHKRSILFLIVKGRVERWIQDQVSHRSSRAPLCHVGKKNTLMYEMMCVNNLRRKQPLVGGHRPLITYWWYIVVNRCPCCIALTQWFSPPKAVLLLIYLFWCIVYHGIPFFYITKCFCAFWQQKVHWKLLSNVSLLTKYNKTVKTGRTCSFYSFLNTKKCKIIIYFQYIY